MSGYLWEPDFKVSGCLCEPEFKVSGYLCEPDFQVIPIMNSNNGYLCEPYIISDWSVYV